MQSKGHELHMSLLTIALTIWDAWLGDDGVVLHSRLGGAALAARTRFLWWALLVWTLLWRIKWVSDRNTSHQHSPDHLPRCFLLPALVSGILGRFACLCCKVCA